jgi:protein AaeX
MRFNEINLFGLYVAPIAVILGIAWVVFVILRRTTDRFAPVRRVWHPALFELSVYVIIVSSIILVMARWGR